MRKKTDSAITLIYLLLVCFLILSFPLTNPGVMLLMLGLVKIFNNLYTTVGTYWIIAIIILIIIFAGYTMIKSERSLTDEEREQRKQEEE